MAVATKSNEEVMVEQLQAVVAGLAQEKKAKESAIKELDEQIKLAETASFLKITRAQQNYETKKAELEAAIQPLEALKAEIPRIQAEIAILKQAKIDAASEIKAAKGLEIQAANEQVSAAQDRLNKIHIAIDACKEKVSAL